MAMYDFPLGYINGTVNGKKLHMLVDSACSFSTIDLTVYLALDNRPELKPFDQEVTTVNQDRLQIHGYVDVTMTVEDIGPFAYEMLVAEIGEGEAIFGYNLMKLLGAQLDTGKDQIVIAGKSYSYGPCKGRRVARLRCNKAVTLQPRETCWIDVAVEGKWDDCEFGMVSPNAFVAPRACESGVVMNPGIIEPRAKRIQVEVTNLDSKPRRLPKAYELGAVEEVEEVIPFSEMEVHSEATRPCLARVLATATPTSDDDKGTPNAQSSTTGREPLLAEAAPTKPTGVDQETVFDTSESRPTDENIEAFVAALQQPPTAELAKHLHPLMENLSVDLSEEEKGMIRSVLVTFQDVFSDPDGVLGSTGVTKHKIDTGDHPPIKQPARRTPFATRVVMEEEVRKMLKQGVVEASTSAWASPVVLVRKKDGTYRFCVDYRRVNDVTKKDAYPLPRLDDSIEAMGGAQWFSTLDLHSGYWQVEMDEADKDKTAFVTRMGLYQFRVMPFGLTNAPATFERLMEHVLQGMQWEQLQVYLDDIIVFGKTFLIALFNLTQVFIRFRKAQLKMKVKKCSLFQKEVPFLGHIVSREGIKCDPAKIDVVQSWPHPINMTEVRSFLGFATYYRRFIPHFSTVASPLTGLTRKDVEFDWTEECEYAFRRLKESLMTAPVLAYPRQHGQFILDTDASNTGIGAVLSQVQQEEEKVIGYASKTLSKSERAYCTTYKELLAVVKFVKHFKPYLWGQPVIIRTDHASLTWLKNFKEPEHMLARWLSTLNSYDLTIIHRPGARHINADVLSRRVPNRPCPRRDCPCCKELIEAREQKAEAKSRAFGRTPRVGKPGKKVSQPTADMCDATTSTEDLGKTLIYSREQDLDTLEKEIRTPRVAKATMPVPSGEEGTVDVAGFFSDSDFSDAESGEERPTSGNEPTLIYSEEDSDRSPEEVETQDEETTTADESQDIPLEQEQVESRPATPEEWEDGPWPAETPIQLPRRKKKSRPDGFQRKSRRRQKRKSTLTVKKSLEFAFMENQITVEGQEKTEEVSQDEAENLDNDNATLEMGTSTSGSPGKCCPTRVTNSSTSRVTATDQVLNNVEQWAQQVSHADWVGYQQQDEDLSLMIQLLRDNPTRPAWRTITGRSPELKAYWTLWDRLAVRMDLLWRVDLVFHQGKLVRKIWRIAVPPRVRSELLKMVHDHKTGGHLGIAKTYARIKQKFYWPGCKADIARWCQRCHQCALIKPSSEKRKVPLVQNLSGAPMERIAADIVGPLPVTKHDNRYLLVVTDYFTKWVEIYPLPSKETVNVADCIAGDFIAKFGVPRQLHTDQGTEFTSGVIRDICHLLGMEKTQTTPYNPSSDGLVERVNRTIQNMLRAFVNENRDDWDEAVPYLAMAYRATEQESTKCTPNMMMLGRELELPVDVQYTPMGNGSEEERCYVQYAEWLRLVMRCAHSLARKHLEKAAIRQKRNYDGTAVSRCFQTGDWVYLQDFRESKIKLGLKWKGPYVVTRRRSDVTLDIQASPDRPVQTVHIKQVKKCEGDHPEPWVVTEPREDPEREVIEDMSLENLFLDPPTALEGESTAEDPPNQVDDPDQVETEATGKDRDVPVADNLMAGNLIVQPEKDAPTAPVDEKADQFPRTRYGREVKRPARLIEN
jgi:transposase InsO family protein